MKRVVITGMALTSPLGSTPEIAFNELKKCENKVEYLNSLEKFDRLNTKLAAPIKDFKESEDLTRKIKRTMGPVSVMAVTTAQQALLDAALLNNPVITSGETGVSYGSSMGSMDAVMDFYSMCVDNEVKALNSGSYVKLMPQTTAVNISLFFKTTGRLVATSTACTSGSVGIGSAYELIKHGYQKVMISGGAEELHPTQIAIFDTLFATSTKNEEPKKTPAPFDKNRDGLVIGEGSATLILEEYDHAIKRGAKIYAEVIGYAQNTDGSHITTPKKETMAQVMKQALENANLKPEDINYINAHGTATHSGDIAESLATEEIFKDKVPVSTIKSYTGHTLGACGAIEALLSIKMAENKWFCPNLNLETPDENCGKLDYITGKGRSFDCKYIMSNNFAFGGINTSLVLKMPD